MQYGIIAVSEEDYIRAGYSTRTAAKFPPELGGGYMVTTTGAHQLHCMHYIWQDHHKALVPEMLRKSREVPEMYERHYEHCIDYLRQSLMCSYDTTIVTYNWVLDHQKPTPNGNAMHKCVDYDGIQEWLKERAVDMPEGFEWTQPQGQQSLDRNP